MTGESKTRLHKQFSKSELHDVTSDPEDWIPELYYLRGKLKKLGVVIDDTEIITHVLSKIPEEFDNRMEKLA